MKTEIRFVKNIPLFRTQKAYIADFPVDGIPGARQTNHQVDDRQVDVAPIDDTAYWQLDIHGFALLNRQTTLDAQAIFIQKSEHQDAYMYQIEAILHDAYPQYARIEAYDLTVRRRDAIFPAAVTVYRAQWEQPASTAHCDYSQDGARLVLAHTFPGQDAYWENKDFDLLNVWRLLNDTDDWPLALCDYTTVDQESDILLNDSIRQDMIDETSLLHHNEAQKWYYLPNQTQQDLFVFRQTDSTGQRARAFHAAVSNPAAKGPRRESVEVRVVAFYPDKTES